MFFGAYLRERESRLLRKGVEGFFKLLIDDVGMDLCRR